MKKTVIVMLGLVLLAAGVCFAGSNGADEETELFLGAKQYVFQGNWKGARYGLERYLEHYPSGRFAAEANYWLALSMDQLARQVKQTNLMIVMYKRAVDYLDVLLEEYSGSVWEDDAKELRVEIAAALALVGQKQYKKYIEEVAASREDVEEGLLLTALEKISELEPETALPLLEGVLNDQKDLEIRKKVVYIIGAYHGEEALPLLQNIEFFDTDEDVRKEAALWRKRIEMASIPIQLNYYGYTAQIEGEAHYHLITEGKLNVYDFPSLHTHSKKEIEREIKKHFEGKLTHIKFATSATKAAAMPEGRISRLYMMRTAHNLHGFRVEVPDDGIEKSLFDIRGDVSFYDNYEGREHVKNFAVDEEGGQLMAMRHGDEVAILVLQFESLEDADERADEPVYHTEINNVFGATVHSSRQSWSSDELTGMAKGRVVDYGRAKAEIPGKEGKWILVGDILLHSKERRFVGRGAVLYNPKREIAAEAAEIIVPADEPEKYQIAGEKKSKS